MTDVPVKASAPPTTGLIRNIEAYRTAYETMEKAGYIMLVPPVLGQLPANHTFSFHVVFVNPDPKKGEVWVLPQDKSVVQLGKTAYEKLVSAAGGTWNWRACGRVDDGSNPREVTYRAVVRYKGYDGLWHEEPRTKQVNLDALESELRDSCRKKLENWRTDWYGAKPDKPEIWTEDTVRKEIIQLFKHMLGRAETGAMNRTVRGWLGVRPSYPPGDLARGFVVGRMNYEPDLSHPEDRRLMMAYHLGAIEDLYGPARKGEVTVQHPSLPEHEDRPALVGGAGPGDQESSSEPEGQEVRSGADTRPPVDAPSVVTPAPPAPPGPDPDVVAWQEAWDADDAARQVAVIRRLIARKAYTKATRVPIDKFSHHERKGFFEYLWKLPDQEQSKLPWE